MHQLTSYGDLLRRSEDDPWIRWGLDPATPRELWIHQDIVAIQRHGARRGFWVIPLPPSATADSGVPDHRDDVASRARTALEALRDEGRLTRPRTLTISVDAALGPVAHDVLRLGTGGDWEWMWTVDQPPAVSAEDRLIILDDVADAAEINTFSAAHNHRLWAQAGNGEIVRWCGIRDNAGDLIAVGGAQREESGVPHLAGIVTHTGHRGAGLGSAISAGLTRWALTDSGVCTLGMYSDNTAARSVYRRLGFRTAHCWRSRSLLGADQVG